MSEFFSYGSRQDAIEALTAQLSDHLRDTLAKREKITFAVPGGSTPGPIFDALCQTDLDWSRVRVILGDERWVPPDTPRSNAKLVRERLFKHQAAKAEFIPFYEKAEHPEEVLEHVRDRVDTLLPLSVLLLGMGEDMHTASLFPGGNTLKAALEIPASSVFAMRADATQEPRVTLSAQALNSAQYKHLVIFGERKKNAFEAAKSLSPMRAPIRAMMEELIVHWAE